jgi:hypothetical protein
MQIRKYANTEYLLICIPEAVSDPLKEYQHTLLTGHIVRREPYLYPEVHILPFYLVSTFYITKQIVYWFFVS